MLFKKRKTKYNLSKMSESTAKDLGCLDIWYKYHGKSKKVVVKEVVKETDNKKVTDTKIVEKKSKNENEGDK